MLTSEIDGYLTYYDIDDFTDPWKEPEMVLLYHGLGRSVDVWYGWVPVLARHYRVLRTDCRGHGRSVGSVRLIFQNSSLSITRWRWGPTATWLSLSFARQNSMT